MTYKGDTMKRTASLSTAALVLASALGLTACSDSTGPDENTGQYYGTEIEGEWQGQVAVGSEIEIKGISGNIEAALTAGRDVVVTWTKRGQQGDPADVGVEVVPHAGGVTICAVYPDIEGGTKNECSPGQFGQMATREIDVEVDFVVLVPAGVDFNGRTIAGNVFAEGLESNVYGSSISGKVKITTTELAEASTVSGSVDARFGRTEWNGDLKFSAVSGSVTVSVSSSANAEVWASSASGTVSSDFSLPRLIDGSLRGDIGAGGGLLRLSTVAGKVKLNKTP
jgi:hypothetical protein